MRALQAAWVLFHAKQNMGKHARAYVKRKSVKYTNKYKSVIQHLGFNLFIDLFARLNPKSSNLNLKNLKTSISFEQDVKMKVVEPSLESKLDMECYY